MMPAYPFPPGGAYSMRTASRRLFFSAFSVVPGVPRVLTGRKRETETENQTDTKRQGAGEGEGKGAGVEELSGGGSRLCAMEITLESLFRFLQLLGIRQKLLCRFLEILYQLYGLHFLCGEQLIVYESIWFMFVCT